MKTEKEYREKELCRMRIKILQDTKEDLLKKIYPLLSENNADIFYELQIKFDEVIDNEAKFLA